MMSLILVGRPETRHIMVLAMAAPAIRERQWGDYPLDDSLSRIVSGHVSRWILARRGEQDIEVIWTRNYVARQTNLYAKWLLFRNPDFAEEFLRSFPRLNVQKHIERLEHDRQELAGKVEARLRRGGFDLGKIPPEQRRAVAQRYVEADDKLRDMSCQVEQLKLAASLREEWATGIEGKSGSA